MSGLAVHVGKALAYLMVIGIGRSGVGGNLMIAHPLPVRVNSTAPSGADR